MRARSMAMVMAVLVAACATSEPVPEPPKPAPVEPRSEPRSEPSPPPSANPSAPPPAPVVKAEPPPAPKPPPRVYPTQRPGDAQHTILVGKLKRTYVLHVPRGYDPAASVPLVVFLHARGSGTQTARNYGFSTKADAERFAVAYPEALGQPRVWNAVHDHGRSDADDAAFVLAMLDEITSTLNVDPRRIYLVGYSSGGMMAYRLAATSTPRFAAVAVVAASVASRDARGAETSIPRPQQPISVMHVHGKLDRTVPYDGGKSVTLAGANYVSAADSARFWVMSNGCAAKPRTTQITNVQRDVYTECRGGTTVELVTVTNLSHAWPGALRIDPRKPAQGAADVVWDFFAVQARQ